MCILQKKSQIDSPSFYFKKLENEQQIKLKLSKRREIIKSKSQFNRKQKNSEKIKPILGGCFFFLKSDKNLKISSGTD